MCQCQTGKRAYGVRTNGRGRLVRGTRRPTCCLLWRWRASSSNVRSSVFGRAGEGPPERLTVFVIGGAVTDEDAGEVTRRESDAMLRYKGMLLCDVAHSSDLR